jgi:hypothetical protein
MDIRSFAASKKSSRGPGFGPRDLLFAFRNQPTNRVGVAVVRFDVVILRSSLLARKSDAANVFFAANVIPWNELRGVKKSHQELGGARKVITSFRASIGPDDEGSLLACILVNCGVPVKKAVARRLEPVHPGEMLREEFMKPLGLSMNKLAKHLPAYLDEMCFRFNNRKNQYLFRDTIIKLIQTPHLEYKELTAKEQDAA